MREGCSGTPADDALAPPLGASPWERTLFDHLTTSHRPGARTTGGVRSGRSAYRVEGACISHQLAHRRRASPSRPVHAACPVAES